MHCTLHSTHTVGSFSVQAGLRPAAMQNLAKISGGSALTTVVERFPVLANVQKLVVREWRRMASGAMVTSSRWSSSGPYLKSPTMEAANGVRI